MSIQTLDSSRSRQTPTSLIEDAHVKRSLTPIPDKERVYLSWLWLSAPSVGQVRFTQIRALTQTRYEGLYCLHFLIRYQTKNNLIVTMVSAYKKGSNQRQYSCIIIVAELSK